MKLIKAPHEDGIKLINRGVEGVRKCSRMQICGNLRGRLISACEKYGVKIYSMTEREKARESL